MSDVVIVEGEESDFVSAVDLSHKHERWLLIVDDLILAKRLLGNNMLFAVAKTKNGEFAGSCLTMIFQEMAFVALYFVVPEYRGKGVGSKLFAKVVPPSIKYMNIGLHGALKMSSIYDKVLGFSHFTPWVSDDLAITNIDVTKIQDTDGSIQIRNIKDVDENAVFEYDSTVYKGRRDQFIKKIIIEPSCNISKVLLDASGKVIGYGRTFLANGQFPMVGPLYCDSRSGFLALFKALITCQSEFLNKGVRFGMRAPSYATPTIEMLLNGAATITKETHCIPQFTKLVPDHDIDRIYALWDLNVFI